MHWSLETVHPALTNSPQGLAYKAPQSSLWLDALRMEWQGCSVVP